MTIRMLLSRAGERVTSLQWVSVLVSAGAHDTYLRTYQAVIEREKVLEFMLLDKLFPRSVFHALCVAEHNLSELEKGPKAVSARRLRRCTTAGAGAAR